MRLSALKKHELVISVLSVCLFTLLTFLLLTLYIQTLSQATNPPVSVKNQTTAIQGVTDIHKATPTASPSATPTQTPTPTQISATGRMLQAINRYRQSHGIAPVLLDPTLQTFAQSRADLFSQQGSMDNHAGFQSMLTEDGFAALGFNALGENSSFGAWENEKNLIESFYANSPQHNENQLNSEWTHIGIGIAGNATNFVFGGKKR